MSFKIKVIENIGYSSECNFGKPGTILNLNNNILIGLNGCCWGLFNNVEEINDYFESLGIYKTVFESVGASPNPCPFCGNYDIGFSVKNARGGCYHISMYCKKCHCYGSRKLIKKDDKYKDKYGYFDRTLMNTDEDLQKIAIELWNKRKEE